jgi:MHS family proline/betaine transporter-like MFS transporter
MLFLVEHAPPERRGAIGGWLPFSASLGILLGSGVGALLTTVVSQIELESWAWRLPFLFGFLIGGLGLWIRTGVEETPSFETLKEQEGVARFPVVEALSSFWRPMLQAGGISVLNGVCFYLVFVYLTTYLSQEIKLPISEALTINTISMMALAPMFLFFGWLSDRVGRRPAQLVAAGLVIALAHPLFVLLQQGGFAIDLAVQLVFAVLLAATIGPQPTYLVELIPAKARYSVLSIGYNLALGTFGGAAPLIATFLIEETGDLTAPSYYLMAGAAVTLITLLCLPETKGRKLT